MLTCSVSGRRFKSRAGMGWYQAALHKPGTTLQMKVVCPEEVARGWQPTDYMGKGPEAGRCGILEKV